MSLLALAVLLVGVYLILLAAAAPSTLLTLIFGIAVVILAVLDSGVLVRRG